MAGACSLHSFWLGGVGLWTAEVSVCPALPPLWLLCSLFSPRSVAGMPWGVLVSGIEQSDWGHALGEQLLQMSKDDPCRDFLVGSRGVPISYTSMLSHFRSCLVQFGGVEQADVSCFSVHSLKTTTLSWAMRLGVKVEHRAAQGHHRQLAQAVVFQDMREMMCYRNYSAKRPFSKLCCSCPPIAEPSASQRWELEADSERDLGSD